jgi:hypothetical protein
MTADRVCAGAQLPEYGHMALRARLANLALPAGTPLTAQVRVCRLAVATV